MAGRSGSALLAAAAAVAALLVAPATAGASGGGLALGDSITVGAQRELQAAGYEVDAAVGRTVDQGLAILAARGGSLPPQIVVNLGTNSGMTPTQCQRLISLVGPDHDLTLVTVNIPNAPAVAQRSNQVLASCAQAAGARLLDWAAYTRNNPGVLCPDGIHISCGGAAAYASFIVSGAGTAAQGTPPAGAAPSRPAQAASNRPSAAEVAARQAAEQAAAAEAARVEAARAAAAAEAARVEAQRQLILQRIRRIVEDPASIDRSAFPDCYKFVSSVERLSGAAAS